jgi:hypothetical protein
MDKGTQAYPLSNYAPGGEGGAILVVMFGNGVKIPLVPAIVNEYQVQFSLGKLQ